MNTLITIRRAEMADIPSIMEFLDQKWKHGNILATNRSFFEWQFVDDGRVNVFIGIDENTGTIYGTIGMILYNHGSHPDASGCMWQTIRSGNPALGLDLSELAEKSLNVRYFIAPQMSMVAQRIEILKGNTVFPMKHYYRLNPDAEYRIASVEEKEVPTVVDTGYRLQRLEDVSEMQLVLPEVQLLNRVPAKDYRYIRWRYFEHPVYSYDVWAVVPPCGVSESVLVTRDVEYEGSGCCKIVDWFGNDMDFAQITAAIDRLIGECSYEYIDIYFYGLNEDYVRKAGFSECTEKSANIIPNYFHPFERRNVDLIMADPRAEGAYVFRGDGDQDRPG